MPFQGFYVIKNAWLSGDKKFFLKRIDVFFCFAAAGETVKYLLTERKYGTGKHLLSENLCRKTKRHCGKTYCFFGKKHDFWGGKAYGGKKYNSRCFLSETNGGNVNKIFFTDSYRNISLYILK